MQSLPLLSPRARRSESFQQGRRTFVIASIVLSLLAAFGVGYFVLYNNPLRSYVEASQESLSGAFKAAATLENVSDINGDSDDAEVPLPRLKPQSLRTKFELEAEPAEVNVEMGIQKDTSAGVRASIGETEEPEEVKPKKSRKKSTKKKKDAEAAEDDTPFVTYPVTDGEEITAFPVCDQELSDVVPCLERKLHKRMKLKLTTKLMEHYERHCPTSEYRVRCLVPPPPGYKTPIAWPESRDEVWVANVPHTFLAKEKSDQHWMVVEGDKIKFPGGGTHFHDGADKYIQGLGRMLGSEEGDLSLGGKVRTALDVGCGVASFGGYLLQHNILAMSVAPNDVHQNQIQFALERGIPAWLGVLGTMRLPFPSKSFDLSHCSRCRIDWAQRDGVLLTELDRVLRPGGYWVWSAPPAYRNDADSKKQWQEVTDVTNRLCWTIAAHKGQTVIFQKPLDGTCYAEREPETQPPVCESDTNLDDAWYIPMASCIAPAREDYKVEAWPQRLTALPPRYTPPSNLPSIALTEESLTDAYDTDLEVWKARVEDYLRMIGESATAGSSQFVEDEHSFRNVMDMNSHVGGFGAALSSSRPVWVMNVAPADSSSLGTVYDRGMLGIYHNWCEEFSTYPRTYDLLHAWQVVSRVSSSGCSVHDFLLEADRILRPRGYIVFRDTPDVIATIQQRAVALRWVAIASETAKKDELNKEKENVEAILVVQKTAWEVESQDKDGSAEKE